MFENQLLSHFLRKHLAVNDCIFKKILFVGSCFGFGNPERVKWHYIKISSLVKFSINHVLQRVYLIKNQAFVIAVSAQ